MLTESLEVSLIWLRGCIECEAFLWDGAQLEAAKLTLAQAESDLKELKLFLKTLGE